LMGSRPNANQSRPMGLPLAFGGVLVLNYHGVIDHARETSHFAFLFSDMRDFAAQMTLLARRAVPVSAEELEAAVLNGHRLPEAAVHVTFDDGYQNNLVAAEILDRHRIPWSMFAVANCVIDGYRPWFLRLADAVDATSNVMLPDGTVFEMSSVERKRAFNGRVESLIMAAHDQDAAVDRICAWKGMRQPDERRWPLLRTAELKELASAGVAIGNHSARHRNLTRCSAHDLASEVSIARRRLEGVLGGPVRHFAYPGGRHDRHVREAVGAEHALGFATWTLRSPRDPMAIRRYEPISVAFLERILARPEPAYTGWWLRWNAAARIREIRHRLAK
jgi:peptidoglycan/xylan/chitin deacetylase (PgdA/CDA1 family)